MNEIRNPVPCAGGDRASEIGSISQLGNSGNTPVHVSPQSAVYLDLDFKNEIGEGRIARFEKIGFAAERVLNYIANQMVQRRWKKV
jgi:hypothetical protein